MRTSLPSAVAATLDGTDLLFLLGHGVPAVDLAWAAIEARRTGASLEETLVARGVLTMDAFYRALAAECGLPFVSRPMVACEPGEVAGAVASGHARAADGAPYRFVAAPRGIAIRTLAAMGLRGRGPEGLAVTTPERLEAAILRCCSASVARAASDALPDQRPGASYRSEARPAEVQCSLAGIVLAGAAGGSVPDVALVSAQAILGILFLLSMALRIAAAGQRPPPQPPDLPGMAELPDYTVLVPLYREGPDVIRDLLAALGRLDYPVLRREILLLVEAGDAQTRAGLAQARLPHRTRIVVCPDGAPRTKPRALNIGLAFSRGDLVVVYDAEDRPDPLQLRRAAARFRWASPDIGCLQAALVIHNADSGWLARLFRLEYAILFDVTLPGLTGLSVPVPLGGTSNHFRRSALEAAGGWDAWNVTEDADIGLRLARQGQRTAMLMSTTLEEAPATLRRWFPQRVRWLKGWMQTALVHSRAWTDPWPGGPVARLAVLTHGWGTVLAALGGPPFLGLMAWDIVQGHALAPGGPLQVAVVSLAWVVLVFGALTLGIPAVMAAQRRGITLGVADLLLALPYIVLVSAAAWCALWELLDKPFQWNKTEHGRGSELPPG